MLVCMVETWDRKFLVHYYCMYLVGDLAGSPKVARIECAITPIALM